jgi:hypothetical protein
MGVTRGHRGPIVDKLTDCDVMFFVQNVGALLKTQVGGGWGLVAGIRLV